MGYVIGLLCLILVAINPRFIWLFIGIFLLFISGYGQPEVAPVSKPAPGYWEGMEK